MRTRTVVALILGLTLVACGRASAASTTTTGPTSTTVPTTPTSEPAPMSRPIVMWGDPSIVADFGDGWTVSACEGGAPLLCFEFEGAAVGTAEALWFPVSSFPDIDPGAEPDTILSEFAAGFVQALEEDRTSACGTEHVFTPIPTTSFPLGDSGVAYGYQATNADGSPSELNLQYATVVGDHILSIVAAAYDEAGCPGRDDTSGFDSVSLSAVRDHLETVLAESPMPQGP